MTERNRILLGAGATMGIAALLAGSMGAAGAILPDRLAYSPPTHEAPTVDTIGPREKRNRKLRERMNRRKRRAADTRPTKRKLTRPDAYMRAVNGLTGWQRNQWARAGYPGSKKREANVVAAFASQASMARFRRHILSGPQA